MDVLVLRGHAATEASFTPVQYPNDWQANVDFMIVDRIVLHGSDTYQFWLSASATALFDVTDIAIYGVYDFLASPMSIFLDMPIVITKDFSWMAFVGAAGGCKAELFGRFVTSTTNPNIALTTFGQAIYTTPESIGI